jgi:MAternally-affected-uncoordination protein
MTCGNVETANGQFMMALQTADAGLQFFVWLNQALLSLSSGNHAQFRTILERIAGSPLPESSVSLKTCVHFIRGVHSLFVGKQTEAKHYLRDALVLANEHDLNRLTASILLLLGSMFLSFGSVMEASDMIMPALQIASKIPDMHLQLWAASQITDLYRMSKNETKMIEARDSHSRLMHALSSEKAVAQQTRHHVLIHVEFLLLLQLDLYW